MKATLDKAFGYQHNAMALPVASVEDAVSFYEQALGFRVVSRSDTPHKTVVLARDTVQMALVESGGDPTQDGCAFHVTGLDALLDEFKVHGISKGAGEIGMEDHGGTTFRVFYVIAPDGLCYWFGEKQ